MSLHSWRSTGASVRATGGSPVTHAYLVSHPLPADAKQFSITIISRDQGFYSDPSGGSWTWFEASIARRENECGLDKDLLLTAQHKTEPEDFAAEIEAQGYNLLPLSGRSSEDDTETEDAKHSVRIHTHEIPCRDWQTWSTTWSHDTGQDLPAITNNPEGLLNRAQAGDCLIIWARALVRSLEFHDAGNV